MRIKFRYCVSFFYVFYDKFLEGDYTCRGSITMVY